LKRETKRDKELQPYLVELNMLKEEMRKANERVDEAIKRADKRDKEVEALVMSLRNRKS
jgi:hypothetical protein